ncbi:hypothetical protein [Sphingomonas oligophenolica]|uniref:Uncharacterized protein n=1 Tax=Sphingomonas oligophenolica TaxID=301154 RepID=A0A502CDM6_9SPHN|nr:hypothetical protein [Sphingomonas oligophenolica]TPG10903.1 hypothetical protein EAH84_11500 [Sphingomonas oligophenolica]
MRSGAISTCFLAGGGSIAQTPPAPDVCVSYDSVYTTAPLMKVVGKPDRQAHFHQLAKPCPAGGLCGWRRKGYLTPGDVVLASAPKGGFRCVYFLGAGGKITAGFVATASLQSMAEQPAPDPRFLTGVWRQEDGGVITISARAGAALYAKGQASYGDNFGSFVGPVVIAGSHFMVTSNGCEIVAKRRGPYLAVSDNNACGGVNVSFGGLYARSR